MKPYLIEFMTIAIAHFFAVASPGPDFAVVTRQTVNFGRRIGIYTALGVATAILLHVSYSLLGVAVLLKSNPMLFNAAQVLAALYLFYIAWQCLKSQGTTLALTQNEQQMSATRAFRQGFLTNGLNPKATLFFLSLFTVVIAPTTPLAIKLGYGVYLAMATGLWFCFLAAVIGHSKVRAKFVGMSQRIDQIVGVILAILGVNIIWQVTLAVTGS